MLYATTRSKSDTFTAFRALREDRSPDGGFYIPFRTPVMSCEQLEEFTKLGFTNTVAQILNLFFSCRLTSWDVECCIGKSPVKVLSMNRRVILASVWHNPCGNYAFIENALYRKMVNDIDCEKIPTWATIAIRIAVLFGIYCLTWESHPDGLDVSVVSGDFSTPFAVWFARQMGLPIGKIICTCNENSAPWDFIHRGELNTGSVAITSSIHSMDHAVPTCIEYLIYATLGTIEVEKYLKQVKNRAVYQIATEKLNILNKNLYVSVVGKDRVEPLINSVYRSAQFIFDPYTAVSYGGLQDYRAKTGESCTTLLLWDMHPVYFIDLIQRSLDLSETDIKNYMKSI